MIDIWNFFVFFLFACMSMQFKFNALLNKQNNCNKINIKKTFRKNQFNLFKMEKIKQICENYRNMYKRNAAF